jgi:hypothetical protein
VDHSPVPSPQFQRKPLPASPTKPRPRSFSFSALEEFLSPSFSCVRPIAGATSLKEKIKWQEVATGTESFVTFLKRKARRLGKKQANRQGHRKQKEESTKGKDPAGNDRTTSTRQRRYQRMTSMPPMELSMPPIELGIPLEKIALSTFSEEPPQGGDISPPPAPTCVVTWPIDTSKRYPVHRLSLGSNL